MFVCLSSYVWHEERPLFDSSKVFIKNISETSIDVSTAARRLKDASCSVCVRAGVSARARGISCVCLSRRAAVLSLSRLKWINRSVARHSAKSEEVEFFFFSPPPNVLQEKRGKNPLKTGIDSRFIFVFLFFSFGTSNHPDFFISLLFFFPHSMYSLGPHSMRKFSGSQSSLRKML